MPFVKQIGILALLAAVVAGGYFGWQQFTAEPANAKPSPGGNSRDRVVNVETEAAAYRDLETLVEAVGSTRARRAVEVTPLASGRVVEIGVEAGKSVSAGDVLLRLDDDIQRADLIEANARHTAAAKALKRAQSLKRSSAVAEATVEKLVAELAISQAEKDRAARRLRDRTVTAPFDGMVGFSNVELGARVDEGDMVTTLDDLSVLEIELSLPEGLFGRVGPGQRVVADAAAYPGRIFEGAIETIDSRIDPTSRSFKVRALVPNLDLVLPAGMFMHLSVLLGAERALTVPEEAVVVDGSAAHIFVITDRDDGARAEQRNVTLGRRSFGIVEIIDGVDEGMDVVIRGVQKVREGTLVRRPKPAAAPAKADEVSG